MSVEILTFGCRLNTYESEVMRGHAGALDDTIIVNTCAVTAEAERQARQAIRRAARARPDARIVVTGCAAQIAPDSWRALPGVAGVLGNAEKLRGETWAALPAAPDRVADIMDPATPMPPPAPVSSFAGRARAFVQVQQGCDHRCTFCVIPYGRGPSRSVAAEAVIAQGQSLLARGYRELVLTGVDIASYGAEDAALGGIGALARRVLAALPGLARLRLSSLDPAAIDEDFWALLAEEPRLMPHLHLSVQAGSDLILKRMKRRHSRAQALTVIARARALRPGIAIGADLIAGFPTETEALFDETLAFIAEASIPYLHVFPYSARPGTPAARMPAIPVAERRARAARLREAGLSVASAFHAGFLGQEIAMLHEADGRGHSAHFAPVRLETPLSAAIPAEGALLRALVRRADAHTLYAEAQ